MSLPPLDAPASLSTSGYEDGLGRRVLVFDREYGVMLERLLLRPELAAFEEALSARRSRLAAIEDERFARVRAVERDPETGQLTVLSEFVAGHRLSDLLDAASLVPRDENAAPSVDVALGFLLEMLPAVAALHATAGLTHGAINPGRLVVTPAGQIVLLDVLFGKALERLRFTPFRLWRELRLAVPVAEQPARFDVAMDLAQTSLAALAIASGRPLADGAHPHGLTALITEVTEIAQLRGSQTFASGLQRFFERTLPFPDRQTYSTADQALLDLQRVVQLEMGADAARRALTDFVAELGKAPIAGLTVQSRSTMDTWRRPATVVEPDAHVRDAAVPSVETPSAAPAPALAPAAAIPLSHIVLSQTTPQPPAAVSFAAPAAIVEEPVTVEAAPTTVLPAAVVPAIEAPEIVVEPTLASAPPAAVWRAAIPAAPQAEATSAPPPPLAVPAVEAEAGVVERARAIEEPAVAAAPTEPDEWTSDEREMPATVEAPAPEVEAPVETQAPLKGSRGNSRRKKTRGPRAKRDKLRSITATPAPLAAKPAPPPPAPARAAAPPPPPRPAPLVKPRDTPWEAPPESAPVLPPAPVVAVPPAATAATPVPPPPPRVPVLPFQSAPDPLWQPPATQVPLAPLSAAPAPHAPGLAPLRLKPEPPRRSERSTSDEIYAAPAAARLFQAAPEAPPKFPWKLAAAMIALTIIGVSAGRAYIPSRSADGADHEAAEAREAAVPPVVPASVGGSSGSIFIETQPAGATVLLDGRPAGESPVTLDGIAPGKHVVTLTTQSGSVKRVVRVENGKRVSLDVAVFSGWVAVYAPIVLDVSENGQSLGTTEQGKILLPPGHHALTLTNRQLGYTTHQVIEVAAGEERAVTIDPKGDLNLNALPWAEVWIDGKKAGETPIANLKVPLGTREVVFKHPEFGERRLTTTVNARSATALSVDFTKPSTP